MKFELGKCYEHTTGGQMIILQKVKTIMWEDTLLAELCGGGDVELMAVGDDEGSAVNWSEIPKDKFMKENYSK